MTILLYLVSKSIMDLHKGTIFVKSSGAPGEGCVFSIVVPIHKDTPTPYLFLRQESPKRFVNVKGAAEEVKLGHAVVNMLSPEKESFENKGIDEGIEYGVSMDRSHNSPQFLYLDPRFPTPEISVSRDRVVDGYVFQIEEDFLASGTFRRMRGLDARVVPETMKIGPACDPRCLVVDDSTLNRKMLARYLNRHFTNILFACDGKEACKIVAQSLTEKSSIDIIFMDSAMPVMDGLEATMAIREMGFMNPILGVTGNSLPEQIEEFLKCGATTIIQKPVNFEHLAGVIAGNCL